MAENEGKKRGRPVSSRRLMQLYAALLYNAHAKGFIEGKLYTGPGKNLCVPGLNCYSCPGAAAACPLGSLQNALAASGHTAPWYALGILLLFGITLGRAVCGWLCPMGLIQELLHKIPTPKIKKSAFTRALSCLKYGVLAVFAVAVPLYEGLVRGQPLPAFCKYICPAGTLEGAAALLSHPDNGGLYALLGPVFTRKAVILILIGLACIFCYRAFCRFLCPLGAIYSLFSRFALTGVRVDAQRCTGCGRCVRMCEMDVRSVGDRECIACGRCMADCPRGAISLRCGRVALLEPEAAAQGRSPAAAARRRRAFRVARACLLAALAAVLLAVNLPFKQAETPPTEPETAALSPAPGDGVPTGSQAGMRMEDFSCTLLDGTPFRLSDWRGHVIVINQWATYCAPCVSELPAFEQLQEEHPEIVVLVFHHWPEASPKAADFIQKKGWQDWRVRFAADTAAQEILRAIGGDNTMPRTVVLDPRGVVVYNEQRSVTYDLLTALLEKASAP